MGEIVVVVVAVTESVVDEGNLEDVLAPVDDMIGAVVVMAVV